MVLLISLFACQVMDQPGHAFAPVEIVQVSETKDEANVETQTEELFEDPQEELIIMGEEPPEEPAQDPTTAEEVSEEVQPEAVPTAIPSLDSESTPTSTWKKASVRDGWKPMLVGTVMDGPSPHAILQMPSGDKVVIQAGDMLADDGVVVMSIGTNFVDLAIVNGSEGRASIQNLTLSSQY